MSLSAHKTEGVNRTQTVRFYPFVSTGKERDEETGYGYFGARYMDHFLMTMWLSVDPLADKYPSTSPYAYCAWNPVRLIDPDGRDIWIGDILYSANMSSEGYDDFSKRAIIALNEIYQTDEGRLMLDFLISSDMFVNINSGYTTESFVNCTPENMDAFFDIENNKPGTGKVDNFDIDWNSINSGGQYCINGIDKNTMLDLADELAHAYDVGNGWAYKTYYKDGVLIDEGVVNGYDKREFQAAYRVNIIREQMGNTNYRSKYYGNLTIANNETYFKPCWYNLRTTDKKQRITFDIP